MLKLTSSKLLFTSLFSFSIVLAGCSGGGETAPPPVKKEVAPTIETAPKTERSVEKPVKKLGPLVKGTFSGLNDHVVTGSATIIRTEDGVQLVFSEDFSLDGAPDPSVGFGNGEYIKETNIADLKNLTGAQTYEIPKGLSLSGMGQVYIWCDKFSVALGVANFKPYQEPDALDDTYGS